MAYTLEFTDASSISELTGIEWYAGASIDPGIVVSADYVGGITSDYEGLNLALGCGIGALPAQVQGGFTGGVNILSSTWFTTEE